MLQSARFSVLGNGVYDLSEAARYAGVPLATVRSWFKPRADGKGKGADFQFRLRGRRWRLRRQLFEPHRNLRRPLLSQGRRPAAGHQECTQTDANGVENTPSVRLC